ncbi:hypothetical protein BD410DRAFT_791728 [Rickenella mellea]|uniref:Uncharacterized protein n=1 Tax=Rickenella mellea TaxID=50990 RepID=A0A4Y7PZ00_9AGAM|nr:hypothetical protein BD410DRAFT_791728 [Rickenella mellea]
MSTCPNDSSSAIQKLAPELLSEIFLLCLPESELWSMRNASQAPLLLGRVCSRWRTIAHSSAALWSHFSVGDFSCDMQKSDYAKDIEALQICMERSWSHPISVTIILEFQKKPTDGCGAPLEKLLLAIISQSSRWRSVIAMIPWVYGDEIAAAFCTKNVSKLEYFKLLVWGSSPPNTGRMSRHRFTLTNAPRLTHLELSADINIDFHGTSHRIKLLEFHHGYNVKTDLGDLITCLIQCPHLTTLFYRLSQSSHTTEFPAILNLTHLRSLRLYFYIGADPNILFDHILVPKLSVLELEHAMPSGDWPSLLNMLKRCRPPLTSLTLNGIHIREQALLECLSLTPELRILRIYHTECTDVTMAAFTFGDCTDNTSANLCPRLRWLQFGIASHFSEAAMKRMVLSRWRVQGLESPVPSLPVKIVGVSYTSLTDEILSDPAILKCMDEGLRLCVAIRVAAAD